MDIAAQLTQLGLNEKQAKIYVALIELGTSTALEISRHAQIKRSTVYVVLGELKYQKLISEIKKGSTTLFCAAQPDEIGKQLEARLSTFRNIKPMLDDLYTKEGGKPNVKFYSGLDEIKQLYERILLENSKVKFFKTDIARFDKAFPGLFQSITSSIHDGHHVVHEIVTDNPYNRAYARKNYHPRFHHIRIIPRSYGFFGDNALYANTMLVTSLSEEVEEAEASESFSVTIESKDLQQTFSTLFQIAWDVSRTPRDLRKKK